jgi:inner membrane protein
MSSFSFDFIDPTFAWFLIGIILFFLELLTPTLLIFFFGFGAWFTSVVLWGMPDLTLFHQLLTFLISSLIFLALLRSEVKKRLSKQLNDHEGNMDNDYLGQFAVVINEIKPPLKGKIELNGTAWDAMSKQHLHPGQTVEIIGQQSITLMVTTSQSMTPIPIEDT